MLSVAAIGMTTALLWFVCVIAILPPSEAQRLPSYFNDGRYANYLPFYPYNPYHYRNPYHYYRNSYYKPPSSTEVTDDDSEADDGTWEWFKEKYGERIYFYVQTDGSQLFPLRLV